MSCRAARGAGRRVAAGPCAKPWRGQVGGLQAHCHPPTPACSKLGDLYELLLRQPIAVAPSGN